MELVLMLTVSLLILLSVLTIFNSSIRKAIILNGIVSTLAAFTFLQLIAPDVALAEAVIGSTLSTIVILMAIRHIRVIHVVYSFGDLEKEDVEGIFEELYADESHDVQYATNDEGILENFMNYPNSDFIVEVQEKAIYLYSAREGSDFKMLQTKLEGFRNKELILLEPDEKGVLSYEK